jgi:hypothetical protein
MNHYRSQDLRLRAPRQSLPRATPPEAGTRLAGLATLVGHADFQGRRHLGVAGPQLRLVTDLAVEELLFCFEGALKGPAVGQRLPAVVFGRLDRRRPGLDGWWPGLVITEDAPAAAVSACRAAGLPLLMPRLPTLTPDPDSADAGEERRLVTEAVLEAMVRAPSAAARHTDRARKGPVSERLGPPEPEEATNRLQEAERWSEQAEIRAEARREDLALAIVEMAGGLQALVTDERTGERWEMPPLSLELESPDQGMDVRALLECSALNHALETARRRREKR